MYFCRSSFDSSNTLSKRKAQTEGEDTEEDVEEQKVNVKTLCVMIMKQCVIFLKNHIVLYRIKPKS